MAAHTEKRGGGAQSRWAQFGAGLLQTLFGAVFWQALFFYLWQEYVYALTITGLSLTMVALLVFFLLPPVLLFIPPLRRRLARGIHLLALVPFVLLVLYNLSTHTPRVLVASIGIGAQNLLFGLTWEVGEAFHKRFWVGLIAGLHVLACVRLALFSYVPSLLSLAGNLPVVVVGVLSCIGLFVIDWRAGLHFKPAPPHQPPPSRRADDESGAPTAREMQPIGAWEAPRLDFEGSSSESEASDAPAVVLTQTRRSTCLCCVDSRPNRFALRGVDYLLSFFDALVLGCLLYVVLFFFSNSALVARFALDYSPVFGTIGTLLAFLVGTVFGMLFLRTIWWGVLLIAGVVLFVLGDSAIGYLLGGIIVVLALPIALYAIAEELYHLRAKASCSFVLGNIVFLFWAFADTGFFVGSFVPFLGELFLRNFARLIWPSVLVPLLLVLYLPARIATGLMRKSKAATGRSRTRLCCKTAFVPNARRWLAFRSYVIAAAVMCVVATAVAFGVFNGLRAARQGPTLHTQGGLRVMQYNIFQSTNVYGQTNVVSVADVIRTIAPQVVGLQEANTMHLLTAYVDEVLFLEQYTGLDAYFGLPAANGSLGSPFLSTFPLTNRSAEVLPYTSSSTLTRPLTIAEITVNGTAIKLLCVHLELSISDSSLQALEIARHINATSGPVILMGDFNAAFNTSTIDYITATGAKSALRTIQGHSDTPTYYTGSHIDYIFYKGLNVTNAFVGDAIAGLTSDHYPVIADFVLP